jgi:hypothetical protein
VTDTTVTAFPVEHKALFGGSTKVLSAEEGIVEAIVSVTGIVDEVKDVIVPGAYAKTLAARLPKGVYSHGWDQPVSKALSVKELMPGDPNLPKKTARGEPWPREAGALMVKAQFNLNTQRGRDAYEDVKFFGDEQEWSIGYNVPTGGSRIDHKKGIRYIDSLDLFEFSPVLFGAMPMAGTHSVKRAGLVAGFTTEEKAIPGSYEERQRALEEAASDALGADGDDGWVHVVATFDDRVVVSHYEGKGQSHKYEMPYTMVGEDVTLGEPMPVKITEMVEPDVPAPDLGAEPPAESDMQHKETAYLSPSELAATIDLRRFTE